jgi:zinc/manganese transport system ATP-binding protein
MIDEPVISLKNVTIELGGRKILDDLSLEINRGEFIAVLGPNGAGKSTLLKLLLGLLKPNQGIINVLGVAPHRGNSAIGYAPQHRVLETDLALRARDVVGFGLDGNRWGIGLPSRKRTELVNHALKEVDALQFANAPVGHLSGGEQQRLLIAQSLITNPQILFLDEPLASLDINHGKEVIAQISKLARQRNITVLLVAHDINPLLHVTDRVLFLSNGRGALGTPDEVITSATLSKLYNAPVEVIRTAGRIFVLGVEI